MYVLLAVYCVLIMIASTAGGSLPSLVRLTHRKIQLTLSLVSGVMLGIALLHLLPHAITKLGSAPPAMMGCLAGLLFMFFMVRMFHFHQHDLAVDDDHEHAKKTLCDDDHDHHHVHCEQHSGGFDMSWIGLCFGLSVHTLIDGIALASDVGSSPLSSLAGLGTFLAIVLHKPLDAMSITSLMNVRGWSLTKQLFVSLVFALMCPLGALLFTLGLNQNLDSREMWLGYALAFSAGIFLCISLGDLLPEVHFHSHDRLWLSLMLITGVLIALALEMMHGHSASYQSFSRLVRAHLLSQAGSPRYGGLSQAGSLRFGSLSQTGSTVRKKGGTNSSYRPLIFRFSRQLRFSDAIRRQT